MQTVVNKSSSPHEMRTIILRRLKKPFVITYKMPKKTNQLGFIFPVLKIPTF